ncbi:hypothetical protein PR202_gb16082 [Eleusine coracana subsp. coracana]|uniref:Uncharacterized protein n=1 Tax=Eleusine coracana subsp. coracana TaxID=191504 RepID=A0AAV5EX65_ELECO|nr:hypothetical protein PR202_gb16082 [Eleusine coracana subsp. coracana]
MGLERSAPSHGDWSFAQWWAKAICKVKKEYKRGVNSVIILTAWILWKHRNGCVFDGTPPFKEAMRQFRDEYKLWCMAGAQKLQDLQLHGVGILG